MKINKEQEWFILCEDHAKTNLQGYSTYYPSQDTILYVFFFFTSRQSLIMPTNAVSLQIRYPLMSLCNNAIGWGGIKS